MIEARPCKCGALPRERIGDGFPMAICGISMGAPFGTYLYCPVCGERTNSFREPLEAYNAWNRKMDYLTDPTAASNLCCEKECAPRFGDKDDCEFYLNGTCTAKPYVTIASTGTPLTPSFHGKDCLGNGKHPGIECCCDECDHYLTCFPDWKEHTN